VSGLTPSGESLAPNETQFTATVRNAGPDAATDAPVHLRVVTPTGLSFFPEAQTAQNVTLAPGESTTVSLNWTAAPGSYYLEAWVETPNGTRDADDANNHASAPFTVDPRLPDDLTHPKPDEKLTIKEFYGNILSFLHLTVLIPLVALFYAAGTVADAREDGSLPYLLTRPVPRWLFPPTKFLASFLVAGLAMLIGVALTYGLLFGMTVEGASVGFLVTPLLISLFALFVYGAVFTLLGVWIERPYLIGLAFVLGWEVVAGSFVQWVSNLTIRHYILRAVTGDPDVATDGWLFDQGLQWLPAGDVARNALFALLGIGVVALVASSIVMKRREFEI
jgi:ABC-type transport system involved in multi-copper enzyme maturation permease subunit